MEIAEIRRLLRRTPPGTGDFTQDLDKYLPGNRLTLLSTGKEAFAAMGEAIASARETVHLETYRFFSDKTGYEFARRLMEKSLAGVRVRVIIDGIGSMEMNPVLIQRMRNSGIQILEYRPVAPWRARWGWGRRNHRKILVVDGAVGFTGGMNISDDHAPLDEGGSEWRDMHVRVEGPAAQELERLFRAVWFQETGRWFASQGEPGGPAGPSKVWVAANQEFLHRYTIRSAYLKVLRAARHSVSIANAYFVPDRGIRRALAAAARRGVRVRILVPGRTDVPAAWYAGRYRFDYLLRHGVRLLEWPGPILHAKAAVIDKSWCAVGSYNLDHRSLLHNLEVNLHILDGEFAGQMEQAFDSDASRSRELTLDEWRRRPWLDRFFERFFYFFRYFF